MKKKIATFFWTIFLQPISKPYCQYQWAEKRSTKSNLISKPQKVLKWLLCVFILSELILISPLESWAAMSDAIDATTKINVCGDGVAEGPEDCDNSDLDGQTCVSLNWGGGILSCDIACEFDTSFCLLPTSAPTPTLTLTPTPTSISSTSSDTSAASDQSDSSSSVSTPLSIPVQIIQEIISPLPLNVSFFDLDGNGRLDEAELYELTKAWVIEWTRRPVSERKCDLNDDGRCDLVDFSILMYFVER